MNKILFLALILIGCKSELSKTVLLKADIIYKNPTIQIIPKSISVDCEKVVLFEGDSIVSYKDVISGIATIQDTLTIDYILQNDSNYRVVFFSDRFKKPFIMTNVNRPFRLADTNKIIYK